MSNSEYSRSEYEIHHWEKTDQVQIVSEAASDEALADVAMAVFFSEPSEQARTLAAYVLSRLPTQHKFDGLSVEVAQELYRMSQEGELEFRFPNMYRVVRETPLSEQTVKRKDVAEILPRAVQLSETAGFTKRDAAFALAENIGGKPQEVAVGHHLLRMARDDEVEVLKRGGKRVLTIYGLKEAPTP